MLKVHELDRPNDDAALAAWAETVMAAVPYILASPDTVRKELAETPHALALSDGQPVGICRIRDHVADDGSCDVLVAVPPDARGHGVGSALFTWAERRCSTLGAHRLTGVVDDDATSPAVLEHWGFIAGAESRMSWTDSRTVPEEAARLADETLRLRRLDEVDPHAVWECHQAAALDDPSGFSRRISFEKYLDDELGDPLLRHDLSRVVLDGERCAAFSLVRVAGDRGWSSMTAVAPSRRGRRLSLTVKAATLRAAAQAGVHRCATANSSANAPVLALNARLGYQPLCTVRFVERPAAKSRR